MKKLLFLITLLAISGWGYSQANVPVSSLPEADTIGAPDFYPVVQNGHYKRVSVGVISTQMDSMLALGAKYADTAWAGKIATQHQLDSLTRGALDWGDTANSSPTPSLATQSFVQNNAWGKVGNAGTNKNVNFIGTTDNEDMVFKTNNIEMFRYIPNYGGTLIDINNKNYTIYDTTNNIYMSIGSDPNLTGGHPFFGAGGTTQSGNFAATFLAPVYNYCSGCTPNQMQAASFVQGLSGVTAAAGCGIDTLTNGAVNFFKMTNSDGGKYVFFQAQSFISYANDDDETSYFTIDTTFHITLSQRKLLFPGRGTDSVGVLINDGTGNLAWQPRGVQYADTSTGNTIATQHQVIQAGSAIAAKFANNDTLIDPTATGSFACANNNTGIIFTGTGVASTFTLNPPANPVDGLRFLIEAVGSSTITALTVTTTDGSSVGGYFSSPVAISATTQRFMVYHKYNNTWY